MYIRCFNLLLRNRKLNFSTAKNIDVKSLKASIPDSTDVTDLPKTPDQEFISPLYTQKVGMFTKPGVLFNEDKKARYKAYVFYALTVVSFVTIFSMIKIIPPGHVGIIKRKNGEIDQFNNKGRLAMIYVPFMEKPVAFRITPIRKKIIRTCETLDGKNLEVVIFLTLTAKVPFASHIFSIFGVNYTKGFVEKELNFDIDQVVKKFKLGELIFSTESTENLELKGDDIYRINSTIDKANEEMKQRFEDAGEFNKITVSDVNISYRRPELASAV